MTAGLLELASVEIECFGGEVGGDDVAVSVEDVGTFFWCGCVGLLDLTLVVKGCEADRDDEGGVEGEAQGQAGEESLWQAMVWFGFDCPPPE